MSTKATVSGTRPPHPCLPGNPLPSSAQQPGLTATIRHFMVTLESLVSDYPYEVSPSPGKAAHKQFYHIPYYEISGIGPPPADLAGSIAGDIYLDLSPEQYAAYGRIADGSWKRWFDPQPLHKIDDIIVKHPHFRSRLMWCSDASGMSWFVKTTVSSNQERARERGVVAQDVRKTEETRWREASALIEAGLRAQQAQETQVVSRAQRFTSPLSPPFDSREPSPVQILGKRKTRSSLAERCEEADPYKVLLQDSIERLREAKAALSEEISTLQKQLDARSQESKISIVEQTDFTAWVEKIVKAGVRSQRNGMNPSIREFCDLEAELAADEAEYSKEDSRREDAQILLGLAISEHKKLQQSVVKC
ncbi:hypothetical protein B0H11DRAFT_1302026 [Mycena galericulata]|nr:hypothetical protein B0H11DRAFT_1302026 [Mycena galericulata]